MHLNEPSSPYPYLEWNYANGTATAYLSEEESHTTSMEALIRWVAEQIKTTQSEDQ